LLRIENRKQRIAFIITAVCIQFALSLHLITVGIDTDTNRFNNRFTNRFPLKWRVADITGMNS
jgi:hypothetical protein